MLTIITHLRNFFLEKQNTFACGAIRSNRGQFLDELKNAKLSRGESIYINLPLNTGSLLAVHDKRDVFVLSTIHGTGSVEVRRRGDDTPFPKPTMIDEYNHYMGGVDKLDQLISTYSFTKKSKKWWKKVFFRLLEISVINACILYMKFHPSFASNNRKHKYFRHLLIHEMVQPFLDARANPETTNMLSTPGRPADIDVLRLRGKHFPISMYPKRKTCTACGYKTDKNGKQSRKKTSNYCEKCDLYVCKDCFEKFHTRSKI